MSQLCMNDGIYDEQALDACISWDASTIEMVLLFLLRSFIYNQFIFFFFF